MQNEKQFAILNICIDDAL